MGMRTRTKRAMPMTIRTSTRTATSAVLATAAFLVSPAAWADDAADTATARALGIEGVTLADAGKCKEAIPKLDRAEKLHHAPTTATRLAECEIDQGRLVAGTERLQRVVRERLPANAHPVSVASVAKAQKILDATVTRIPTLRLGVTVSGAAVPPETKLAITIDDESVSDAIVETNRRIDPGSHRIVVRADGYHPTTLTVVFAEGETKSAVADLRVDPAAHAAAAPASTHEPAAVRTESPSKVPAILAFGAGAIGLGIGIYAATVVEDKSSVLSTQCDANRVCPDNLQSEITGAKRWATVSTVGFIAGGVGIASGIVLLVLESGGASSTRTGALPATKRAADPRPRVRPQIGAAAVGLEGTF